MGSRHPRNPSGGKRGDRKPITPGSLSTAWVRMRAAAGIKGLRLHDLRHTTATRVLRATGNLMAASKALGHARFESALAREPLIVIAPTPAENAASERE